MNPLIHLKKAAPVFLVTLVRSDFLPTMQAADFEDVNIGTRLGVEGGHLVVGWSIGERARWQAPVLRASSLSSYLALGRRKRASKMFSC